MRRGGPYIGTRRGCGAATVVGFVAFLVLGLALVWFGFFRSPKEAGETPEAQPSSTPEQTAILAVAAPATQAPTATPLLPTMTPMSTDVPATPTSAVPRITAGVDGANVRTGSDVSYTKVGYLDPGAEATVIGQHDGWWQIDYNGTPAWVYGEIVTAENTDGVPDAMPPASPTPPPATDVPDTPTPAATGTPAPPTATPGPPTFSGLVANGFWLNDQGPFSTGEQIWFNMDITCIAGSDVEYNILGAWVEETGFHKPSWTNEVLKPGQHFLKDDHLEIGSSGTYHLWLRICFKNSPCVNMLGPIQVEVK